jgi:hypothetical protein
MHALPVILKDCIFDGLEQPPQIGRSQFVHRIPVSMSHK